MAVNVYLDFNATAPTRPEVVTAMVAILAAGGNPSSVHQAGRTARNRVEEARGSVAQLLGCKAPEIIFTSGGTEANNFALSCFPDRPLFISAGEHDSVLAAAGPRACHLPLHSNGLLDLVALTDLLDAADGPALVSVMLANNETGVIQPAREIADIIHERGGLFHCDAIQAVGKIPIAFSELGADMMTVSAHKFGGPQGMGALVLRDGLAVPPFIRGGGQELGRRAGTENVAGIVGMGVAALSAKKGLDDYSALAELRDFMEARLLEISPESNIYGRNAPRLPNTSAISMPGVASELQVMSLDLDGIAVSAGSACSSGKVKASHVLTAMGANEEEAGSAIRISLGWSTTDAEIGRLIESWTRLYQRKSPKFAA
ncbi:cysteine desulfurase family protein [Sneathiella litorea]|uniref:Cysteine desulfurase n=1 Tax=Sneathiella litorea TaxID=2606216 RepID=A0A6L8W8D5_9PROT|nr:cysteine desulfurase family protein [Sneathiella litorea]MZR30929.1 aminotransferase class V-fold PLP-dependent enzyme [Sneathiella litorea]